MHLASFFNPKSIAVIGASRNRSKLGHFVFSNICENFHGEIYPVNPKAREILGHTAYASVRDIKDPIDVAVVMIPAPFVNAVVEECGQVGVKNVVVISAGFREIGAEGVEREQNLIAIGERYGMNIIGPNCLGYVLPHKKLNASFAAGLPRKGNIAMFSQSGAMAVALLDWAEQTTIGFSLVVSLGNKAQQNECDMLRFAATHKETKVICLYLEDVVNYPDFFDVAAEIGKKKPIILLKAGRSEAGQQAVSSHTGRLAGESAVFEKLAQDAGIIVAHTVEELLDFAELFSRFQKSSGPRVQVITNAGGPGVMAMDAFEHTCLELATLPARTTNALKKKLPLGASVRNPLDVLGDASWERYEIAVKAALKSTKVDSLVVLLTPQIMTESERVAHRLVALQKGSKKPIVTSFIGGPHVHEAIEILESNNMVHFEVPYRCIHSLNALETYTQWVKSSAKTLKNQKSAFFDVQHVIDAGKVAGEKILSYSYVSEFMDEVGIKTLESIEIRKEIDLEKCTYPIVLKADNAHVYHKTDIDAVRVHLDSMTEAMEAFRAMKKSVKAHLGKHLPYILAQPMIERPRQEMIVGFQRHPLYGPLLMIGGGGVTAELYKDVVFGRLPISKNGIYELLHKTKVYQLLSGFRGASPCDVDSFVDMIYNIGAVFFQNEDLGVIDMNPVFVFEQGEGVLAVDVKITLE